MKKIHVIPRRDGDVVNFIPMREYKRKSRKLKRGMSSNTVLVKATVVHLRANFGMKPHLCSGVQVDGPWKFVQAFGPNGEYCILIKLENGFTDASMKQQSRPPVPNTYVNSDTHSEFAPEPRFAPLDNLSIYRWSREGTKLWDYMIKGDAVRKGELHSHRKAYLSHFSKGSINANLSASRDDGTTRIVHAYQYDDPSVPFTEADKKAIAGPSPMEKFTEAYINGEGKNLKHSYQWVDLSELRDGSNAMVTPHVRGPYPLRQVDIDRMEAQAVKDSGDKVELRTWEDEFGTPFSFAAETEISEGVAVFAKDLLDKVIGLKPPKVNEVLNEISLQDIQTAVDGGDGSHEGDPTAGSSQ